MALDPSLKDHVDGDTWKLLEMLDARIEASSEPPVEHTMRWASGATYTYVLKQDGS